MCNRIAKIRSSAWMGDSLLKLEFPSTWDIHVIQHAFLSRMSRIGIEQKIRTPVDSPSLSELAVGRKDALIIIDDISRPTPTELMLPVIVAELVRSGIDHNSISILVAGGTHQVASVEDISKKIGRKLSDKMRVFAHDMTREDLAYLGKTQMGTPVSVNRLAMEADIKIGLGGIYPHPTAGFSGGSKIVCPGICGIDTAQFLHENFSQSGARGKPNNNRFRIEIDNIGMKIGLDFIVNAIINQDRKIVNVFAGHPIYAHRDGVRYALQHFAVDSIDDADIIISDAYPFDTSFVFIGDRGFWPLANTSNASSKVLIAACPRGMGTHELDLSISQRVKRRLANLSFAEILQLPQRLRNLQALLYRDRLDFYMLASGLNDKDLKSMYSSAEAFSSWPVLLQSLRQRHASTDTRVVIYRSAPLLIDSGITIDFPR